MTYAVELLSRVVKVVKMSTVDYATLLWQKLSFLQNVTVPFISSLVLLNERYSSLFARVHKNL